MNRLFLSKALAKVRDLPEDQYYTLTTEEVALLQSFVESFPFRPNASDRQRALHTKLQKVIARWKTASSPLAAPESGANQIQDRVQQTLREAINKLQQGRFDALQPGEARFVRSALRVLNDCIVLEPNSVRLQQLLVELLRRYDTYRAQATPSAATAEAEDYVPLPASMLEECANAWFVEESPMDDLTGTVPTQTLEADQLFTAKPRRRVARLQGIEANLQVMCYEVQGPVHLCGSVPEETLLVVRDGSIEIDGYVLGHVVAKGDVTVANNISGGWVISSEGDIRARNILSHSSVIAKAGSIACENVELADKLFAWHRIAVSGRVLGTTLLGRDIQIADRATSAEIHVAGTLSAAVIEESRWGASVVCLRRMITCADYGRQLEPATLALHRKGRKLQTECDLAARVIRSLRDDIENCYRTMLYYVHGGGAMNIEAVEALRSIQAKTSYLSLVIEAGQRIEAFVQAALEGLSETDKTEAAHISQACLDTLEEIQNRVRQLPPTPPKYSLNYRETIVRACERLAECARELTHAGLTYYDLSKQATTLGHHLSEWVWVHKQLEKGILDIAGDYGLDPALGRAIQKRPEKLERLWSAAVSSAQSDPESDLARRLRSPFVGVMLGTIDQNRKNVAMWSQILLETQDRLEAAEEELEKAAVALHNDSREQPPRVTAQSIRAGVVITSAPGVVDGVPEAPAPVIRFTEDISCPTTFALQEGTVHRQLDADDLES